MAGFTDETLPIKPDWCRSLPAVTGPIAMRSRCHRYTDRWRPWLSRLAKEERLFMSVRFDDPASEILTIIFVTFMT